MKSTEQSSRQLKVANLIKQCLADILFRGRQLDIRLLENKITITNVKVSADLKIVNCYYLPFGNNTNIKKIQGALDASKQGIRKQVTESINLKYSPEIRFYYDTGEDNAMEVEAALARIKNTNEQ